jgi:hypothetical protein
LWYYSLQTKGEGSNYTQNSSRQQKREHNYVPNFHTDSSADLDSVVDDPLASPPLGPSFLWILTGIRSVQDAFSGRGSENKPAALLLSPCVSQLLFKGLFVSLQRH